MQCCQDGRRQRSGLRLSPGANLFAKAGLDNTLYLQLLDTCKEHTTSVSSRFASILTVSWICPLVRATCPFHCTSFRAHTICQFHRAWLTAPSRTSHRAHTCSHHSLQDNIVNCGLKVNGMRYETSITVSGSSSTCRSAHPRRSACHRSAVAAQVWRAHGCVQLLQRRHAHRRSPQ